MPPKKVPLSHRERTLFARLVQEYETKKYKPALKTADAILSKVPNHGETLAIKGLVLFSINQKEEGLRIAKLGLRYDLTSFICWHALGIVYRMDRNYEESLKCYAQALRIEGGNLNIVRESAFMQLQLRNYGPLIDARLVILRTQPHLRANWIALAIAHDLADNKGQAVRVLAGYEDVQRAIPKHSYEYSEVVLYHAELLLDLGEAEEVLSLLEQRADWLVDPPAVDELRARALQHLERTEEAKAMWRRLLERNADNKAWISAYLDLASTPETRLAVLTSLQGEFPRSQAMRRMALDVAQGTEFEERAREYLERALVRNVPSLFSDVKSLYQQPGKQEAVEKIVEDFRQQWDPRQQSAAAEPPTSYLFAMYFLAHHYSYTARPTQALEYIDSIMVHTPTMPELPMSRARILKRAGAREAAADAMEDARLLDGQDRYLNTKAGKYFLRVNRVDDAARMLKLFTRPEVPEAITDLFDMQALGHLVEDGEAHERRGERALALKRFYQVDKIVKDIYDDQLDFHSYCLRKMTLRAYLKTVRFEDHVAQHPQYLRAARGAIRVLLQLADDPNRSTTPPPPVLPTGDVDETTTLPDPDPHGERLAATATPLQDTNHFVKQLELHAPNDIRTWLSVLPVALRAKKWLLALRAASLATRLDASHPELHLCMVRFHHALAEHGGQLPDETAQKLLRSLVDEVPALGMSLSQLHTDYVQRYGDVSPAHLLAAAEGLFLADKDNAPQAAALAHTLLQRSPPLVVLEGALRLLRAIEKERPLSPDTSAAALQRAAQALWPLADAFQSADERSAAAERRASQRSAWLKS